MNISKHILRTGILSVFITLISNFVRAQTGPVVAPWSDEGTNQSLGYGDHVILRATVTGTAPISLEWRFNGEPLPGMTNASAILDSLTLASSGDYSLCASNEWGVVTNRIAVLSVTNCAPVIFEQPHSKLFLPWTVAALHVKAVGTQPWNVQWWREDVPVEGATNLLLKFASATEVVAGEYFVTISNSFGSARSEPVALSVGDPHPNEIDFPSLAVEPMGTNVVGVIGIYSAGDGSGRLFGITKPGQIVVLHDGQLDENPFLNITNRVFSEWEGGLLGMAFPPDFREKRYFYVDYTRVPDMQIVVSRFHLGVDNLGDPESEEILLRIPGSGVHNGGQIAFGPDGLLYIAVGDSGAYPSDSPSQKPGSLLGKILRIDVESGSNPYRIPPNNPFVAAPEYAPEIWAMGLRNPWRFSFDRMTGDLFIGDVGDVGMEEIDFQPTSSAGGENYGWPYFEGSVAQNSSTNIDTQSLARMTPPIGSWHRVDLQMKCVIGGNVCRNPKEGRLNGIYFFGDFVTGTLGMMKRIGTGWRERFGDAKVTATTFGEDEEGTVYCFDNMTGFVTRFRDTYQAYPPTFKALGGYYDRDYNVTWSETDLQVIIANDNAGATITYTTDGREPTEWDEKVSADSPITVSASRTIKARVFRDDLAPSSSTAMKFALSCASPEFGGADTQGYLFVTNGGPVTITSKTPNVRIYYTFSPDTNVLLYSGPIAARPGFLSAVARREGFEDAGNTVHVRLLPAPTPEVITEAQTTNGDKTIRISTETPAEIRYTLDGGAPSTNSPIYSGPMAITSATILRVYAFATNYAPSAIVTMNYGATQNETTTVTTFAGASQQGYLDGPVYQAEFNSPFGLCFDLDGGILVADTFNHRIRRISRNGTVSTIAGSGIPGWQDGPAMEARFQMPSSVAVDSFGRIWVSDSTSHHIRTIGTNGIASTQPDAWGFVRALWQIEHISYGDGLNEAILAGDGSYGVASFLSGFGFQLPYPSGRSPVGLGQTTDGAVFSSVSPLDGSTSAAIYRGYFQTLYLGGPAGFSDGPRLEARLERPLDLAGAPDGSLIVSDWSRIRRVRTDGMVTTVAGYGGRGYRNGRGTEALFNGLAGIIVDQKGTIFVADSRNHCIRRIDVDSDGDGIPDVAEGETTPYLVGVDDRFVDSDGDGLNNAAEFLAGTDPLSSASRLLIGRVRQVQHDEIEIAWPSVIGKRYRVETSTDLNEWMIIGDPVICDNTTASSMFLISTDRRASYFRIIVDP